MNAHRPSTWTTVRLIAARELRAQTHKKSFVISNALILLLIVGAIVGFSMLSGSDDEDYTIGLVGDQELSASLIDTAAGLDLSVEVDPLGDRAAAQAAVEDGDVDAAVLPDADGGSGAVTVLTDDTLPTDLHAALSATVQSAAHTAALAEAGVDPAQVAAEVAAATVTVETLDPDDPEAGERSALALTVIVLMYMQIMVFGIAVAMGVVEEKSSRVVELLLSTVRPLQLLWGKILGIGLAGLAQLTAYAVVGVATGLATGVLTLTGTALGVLAMTLGWFVLGFTLFAALYAAAGSMVSRQEDVNSITMPLTMLVIAMFVAAMFVIDEPDGTAARVLGWIPPTSTTVMPLRVAAGVADPVQIGGSIAVMVLAIAGVTVLAARIYQRSVLQVGRPLRWREALGAARQS